MRFDRENWPNSVSERGYRDLRTSIVNDPTKTSEANKPWPQWALQSVKQRTVGPSRRMGMASSRPFGNQACHKEQ